MGEGDNISCLALKKTPEQLEPSPSPLASVPRPQLEGGYKYRGRCEPVLPQPSPSSLLAAAGMRSAPGKAARTMKT